MGSDAGHLLNQDLTVVEYKKSVKNDKNCVLKINDLNVTSNDIRDQRF